MTTLKGTNINVILLNDSFDSLKIDREQLEKELSKLNYDEKYLLTRIDKLNKRLETIQNEHSVDIQELSKKLEESERSSTKSIREAELASKRFVKKKESALKDKFEKELKDLNNESMSKILYLQEQLSDLKKKLRFELERSSDLKKERSHTDVELRSKNVDSKRAVLKLPLNVDYEAPVPAEKSIRTLERKVDRLRIDHKAHLMESERLQEDLDDITKKLQGLTLILDNEVKERKRVEKEKSIQESQYLQKLSDYENNLAIAEKDAIESQKAQLELNKTKSKLEALSKTLKKNETIVFDYQSELKDIKSKYNSFSESINTSIDDERKKVQSLETKIVFLEDEKEIVKKNVSKERLNNKNLETQIKNLKELLKISEDKARELTDDNAQFNRNLRYAEKVRGIPI